MKMLADGSESRTRQIKFNLRATDGVAVGTVTQEVNGGSGGRRWVKSRRTDVYGDAGGR